MEDEVAPPFNPEIQWRNPWDDARSTRSLPQYENGNFENVDLEKKELAINVVEVDNSVV